MKGLFIEDNDVVVVEVFVTNVDDKLFANHDKEKLISDIGDKKDVVDDDIDSLKFTFKVPNYKDEVSIVDGAIRSDSDDNLEIDAAAVRYERFVTLLRDWDITDAKDKKVPPNRENINKINPVLAIAVMNALDEKMA